MMSDSEVKSSSIRERRLLTIQPVGYEGMQCHFSFIFHWKNTTIVRSSHSVKDFIEKNIPRCL